MRRVKAVLALRCPRCLRGAVFHGLLQTNQRCPGCGLVFEREAGYFVGAMYASYFLGIVTTLPVWLTLLLTDHGFGLIVGVSFVELLLCVPLYFHYSRVLWLHIDYLVNRDSFESA